MANLAIPAEEIDARLNTVINSVSSNLTITSANVEAYRNSTILFSNASDSTITIEDDVFTANDTIKIKFYSATDTGQSLTTTQQGTGASIDDHESIKIFIDGCLIMQYAGSNQWYIHLKECPDCIEDFIQAGAEGTSSPGEAAAALISYGIGSAREFAYNKDNHTSLNLALKLNMDRSVAPSVRIGWATSATSGDVVWKLDYSYAGIDDVTSSSTPDYTTTETVTASSVNGGYQVTTFTLNAPASTDRIMGAKLTRLGATDPNDTVSVSANFLGWVFAYQTKY